MNAAALDKIVEAVLYEGYILYPYRPSSKKNRRERFTFGRVYPQKYSDSQEGREPCLSQTECLLQSPGGNAAVTVTVRFLHPLAREAGYITDADGDSFQAVSELVAGGILHQTWHEAVERVVTVPVGLLDPSRPTRVSVPFLFSGSQSLEPLNAECAFEQPAIMRCQELVEGTVNIEAKLIAAGAFKITIQILNRTSMDSAQCGDPNAVLLRTLASTHTILQATDGEFVSMMDPPAEFEPFARQCKNIGVWPVLVGREEEKERDTMLSSPVILYDYPQIAPESEGSFFDGTEIDEMLTLRVLTMTDDEKHEMRRVDEYARRILERTEAAGAEDIMRLHGTMRGAKAAWDVFQPSKPLHCLSAGNRELKVGGAVRIHPKKRADAIDLMLEGKTALIEAIEQDAEGQVHLALVVEDDPGRDLGMARQPGHRFFYSVDEVEPVEDIRV